MDEQPQSAQNGDNPQGDELPVSAPEPVRASPQQPSTDQEFKEVEREMSSFERSTLRWTRATFIILGVTCLFIGFQWHEMVSGSTDTKNLVQAAQTQAANMGKMFTAADQIRQAAQDMATNEKRLADDTDKSLKASNAQSEKVLKTSIDAARLDQRAWVGVVVASFDPGPEVKAKTDVLFKAGIANTGKTPALRMHGVIHWKAMLPSDPLDNPSAATIPSEEILFPSGNVPTGWLSTQAVSFSDDQISAIKSGFIIFRVWGEITYSDVFQTPHWTRFCYFLAPDLKSLQGCPMYNETDDEEQTKKAN